MALSNAERQARHRARQKEKLRNAENAMTHENLGQVLRNAYLNGAAQWLFFNIEYPKHEAVFQDFIDEPFTADDISRILSLAGFARILQLSRKDNGPKKWDLHAQQVTEQILRNDNN